MKPPPCFSCLARHADYIVVDGWPYCRRCVAAGEPKKDKRILAQGDKGKQVGAQFDT